jgi:O-antigen biosynthesis protein WbqP
MRSAFSDWLRKLKRHEIGKIMYRKYIKRLIDIVLSLSGLILASWLYLLIAIAIKIDDPGPVFFSQKRIGKDGVTFSLFKYRSMRMSTPHDTPTHLLENPDQYITRVGKLLRKTSLDEIPQLWNILRGDMSVIGPRPALWNQYDLIEERDKYGANGVKPGLSGWAQICGRDELEIEDKARLDGEYVQKMSFLFDCRCFFGTAVSALRGDGVVEGGTGEIHKNEKSKV